MKFIQKYGHIISFAVGIYSCLANLMAFLQILSFKQLTFCFVLGNLMNAVVISASFRKSKE